MTAVQPQQLGCIDNSTSHQLMNELMSDEGVCRTAPATPGLLNTHKPIVIFSFTVQWERTTKKVKWGPLINQH